MDIVTEYLSDNSGLLVHMINSSIILSCQVTLRLGETRDVVLGPKEQKYYFKKGTDFSLQEREFLDYSCKNGMLKLSYSSEELHEPPILFNLKGHGVGNIEDHNLTIYSDHFLWDDRAYHVAGTPMDFREETPIGERIRMGYEPLVQMGGYDHIFLLDHDQQGQYGTAISSPQNLRHAAVLMDRMRTLQMDIYTSFPALYLYTGNHLTGKDIGKGGCIYPRRGGISLIPCDPFAIKAKEKSSGVVHYCFTPLNV